MLERDVHSALLSGDPHDQLAIAYHLILDNKRIEDETSKLEKNNFYWASSPPPSAGSDISVRIFEFSESYISYLKL